MKDERIYIRTTQLNKEKIVELAKSNGMSTSEFILKLVREYEMNCLYDNVKRGD